MSGLLMTMLDVRTNISAAVVRDVRAHFEEVVFQAAIPRSVRISEAPSFSQTILEYDPKGAGAVGAIRALVGRDQMMLEPARFAVKTFAGQGLPAWEFRFDYVGEGLKSRAPNGAPHASEIPFVFDKYAETYIGIVSPSHTGSPTKLDSQVAKTMHAYWVNFAKSGDPNGAGLPPWPRYSAARDELMVFQRDGTARAQPEPWKARMELTEATTEAAVGK
jgi:para-nitrobenzyl esterase